MPRSFSTSGSAKLRPIRRLMAKRVFSGLTTAWRRGRLAYEALAVFKDGDDGGGVRTPSAFSNGLGGLPHVATHELVAPRSMPTIEPYVSDNSLWRTAGLAFDD